MTLDSQKTLSEEARKIGSVAQQLMTALIDGQRYYDEHQSWRAEHGGNDADIATALGVDQDDVSVLNAAVVAMKNLYDCANNVATSQGDRFYSLRKVT